MKLSQVKGTAKWYVITNQNKIPFKARYNNQTYLFPPNEKRYIDEMEGRFIFGIGGDEEEKNLVPIKWGLTKIFFDSIEVEPMTTRPVDVKPALVE